MDLPPSTTPVFCKKTSLLVLSFSSQKLCVQVGLEKRRETEISSFLGVGLLVAWGLWSESNFLYLPQHSKTNSKYFSTFPKILFLFWTLLLPCWSTSFQQCVKMWLKTQLLWSLALLVVSENGMGKFAVFPLVSCLLTISVLCVVTRTKVVNDFFTGTSILHSYCE